VISGDGSASVPRRPTDLGERGNSASTRYIPFGGISWFRSDSSTEQRNGS
jgi:hypothetical protein